MFRSFRMREPKQIRLRNGRLLNGYLFLGETDPRPPDGGQPPKGGLARLTSLGFVLGGTGYCTGATCRTNRNFLYLYKRFQNEKDYSDNNPHYSFPDITQSTTFKLYLRKQLTR